MSPAPGVALEELDLGRLRPRTGSRSEPPCPVPPGPGPRPRPPPGAARPRSPRPRSALRSARRRAPRWTGRAGRRGSRRACSGRPGPGPVPADLARASRSRARRAGGRRAGGPWRWWRGRRSGNRARRRRGGAASVRRGGPRRRRWPATSRAAPAAPPRRPRRTRRGRGGRGGRGRRRIEGRQLGVPDALGVQEVAEVVRGGGGGVGFAHGAISSGPGREGAVGWTAPRLKPNRRQQQFTSPRMLTMVVT